jgi:hypothetical protein
MAKFRSIQEIDKDYYNKVAELGDREFKMTDEFPRQIEALKLELRKLIRESEQTRQELEKEQKKALDKAPVKQPETPADKMGGVEA